MGGESGLKGIYVRSDHIRIVIYHKATRQKPFNKTLRIKPTKTNLKFAQRQREAWLHQLETGQIPAELATDQQSIFIPHLLQSWFDAKSDKLKNSTFQNYRKSVKILSNSFPDISADTLTLGMVRDFCDKQKSTAKTINNLISPLRQSLQKAVEDGDIKANVMMGWSYKKPKVKTVNEVDPFSIDEQKAILSQLDGQTKNLIQLAFWTGMRTSEYIALQWSDVDLNKKTIKINKVRTQNAPKDEAPKTLSGYRTIELLAPALDALKQQKQFTFEKNKEVFLNPRTELPWAGDQPIRRRLWIPALEKAEVRYRRPYQTRHTYASMMLSAGEHPMWVAKQMGHSDWSMIAKIYGKWMPDAMPDAGNKAEKVFGRFLEGF